MVVIREALKQMSVVRRIEPDKDEQYRQISMVQYWQEHRPDVKKAKKIIRMEWNSKYELAFNQVIK